MVDPAELFNILDDGTGAGLSAHSRTEGQAAAAQRGLIGFSFKDNSGNVVLPQLDSLGRLPVTQSSGVCKDGNGELAAGSLSLEDITNAMFTGAVSKTYCKFGMIVSCRHASLFQLVHRDDAAGTPLDTVVMEALVGPGQYTVCCELAHVTVDTTGGTGVQEFWIRGQNFNKLSSMRATIEALEAN